MIIHIILTALIDHLIRRDCALIFMQLLSFPETFENELWLLRGNSGGWESKKSIRFDSGSVTCKNSLPLISQQPKSQWAGQCPEVSTLEGLGRIGLVGLVWFQQLDFAFIILVYPVLRLLYVSLLRTRFAASCRSLAQVWQSLPSETLESRREIMACEGNS